ncbi:hypothetical protein P879_08677 [Paragonimus westermani]|uniref:RRM domain-containing protein n=1 Tax=Paragonimus westermani TaxID=34504 RepID=A0A8T0D3X2_9TREM|nr:hypothetical protein P879_08677 [Paragonimus westermani]
MSEKHPAKNHIIKLRGLPFSIKEAELASFFHDVHLREITLLFKSDGQLSGEAFVVVESEQDLLAALAHNGDIIGRRFIEVQVSSKEQMDWCVSKSQKPDGTLRLVGLPYDVDKSQLAAFFEGFAIVSDGIGLLKDQYGRPTGEAFVQFVSPEVAKLAATKHKQRIGGRYIEIYHSSVKAAIQAIERQMYVNLGVDPNESKKPGTTWFNPYWKVQQTQCVTSAIAAPLHPLVNPADGYSHWKYPSPCSNQEMLGRRPLVSAVLEAAGINYSPCPVVPQQNWLNQHNSLPPVVTHSGGIPRVLTMANQASSSGCHIRMRGLPYSATVEDVVDFFRPIQPLKICLQLRRDGKPSGMADVHFVNAQDTREAMKYQKKLMGSRYVELFSSVKTDF